jgi:hypothetical protein
MSSLRDRFYTGMGVVGVGSLLAASLGGALADRLLHPVDTCRDIRRRRALVAPDHRRRSSPSAVAQCDSLDFHIPGKRNEYAQH